MPRQRTPAPPGHKHCHSCGRDRPVANFARDASKSDGLRVCCRACDGKRQKARYWTKERRQARKLRQEAARRRELERTHGRAWLARQERLEAERREAKRVAEMQEKRDAARGRFFARLRARRESSGSEQA